MNIANISIVINITNIYIIIAFIKTQSLRHIVLQMGGIIKV